MTEQTLSATIDQMLSARPIPVRAILDLVLERAEAGLPADLPALVRLSRMTSIGDECLAMPAVAAMACWGSAGLEALRAITIKGFHGDTAFGVLLRIARGRRLSPVYGFPDPEWLERLPAPATPGLQRQADSIVRELILDQLTNRDLRTRLVQLVTDFLTRHGDMPEEVEYFWSCFVDTHLSINREVIENFSRLLDQSPRKEEELHQFLVAKPVLLDAGAVQILSKHQLGTEFITDFVIRKINDEYVLVEIEKSTDTLYTRSGNMSAKLTHAIGQVMDFQRWVHDNLNYAQRRLPGIRRPDGLVVIGRRSQLDPSTARKLEEENFSRRGHVRIQTYDDLLEQSRVVFANLKGASPVSILPPALPDDRGEHGAG